MVKNIPSESDSESQGEIPQKESTQKQNKTKVEATKSKEGKNVGGRGLDSSPECPTKAILNEESRLIST